MNLITKPFETYDLYLFKIKKMDYQNAKCNKRPGIRAVNIIINRRKVLK